MVILGVILLVLLFIVIDILIRMKLKSIELKNIEKKREEALETGLKLSFADEALSLNRVEVPEPKAKILAVDDEEVILSSFRKILAMDGYSIDTVSKGSEALTLAKKNDYDFVFTDMKMPEMDGVAVTKAIKHIKPDVDVIIVTGYATIETAVETMKFGAMDYVQKPFTEEELIGFVQKALIKRQDRLTKTVRPAIHAVTPSAGGRQGSNEFDVPTGLFVSKQHIWIQNQPNGAVRIGLDDFSQKVLFNINALELPSEKREIGKGENLFSVIHGNTRIAFPSPVDGKILWVNYKVLKDNDLVKNSPYDQGWICDIEAKDLAIDIRDWKIGSEALSWYQEEIDKYTKLAEEHGNDAKFFELMVKEFFSN